MLQILYSFCTDKTWVYFFPNMCEDQLRTIRKGQEVWESVEEDAAMAGWPAGP